MPIVYTSPWYHILGLALCALALAYWAWHSYRRYGMRMSVFVLGLLSLSIVGLRMPSLLFNEIRADDERIEWRDGYWWAEYSGSIRYSEVASVEVRVRKARKKAFQERFWVLHMKDGRVLELALTALWMEHYLAIKAGFEAKGIPVVDGARV